MIALPTDVHSLISESVNTVFACEANVIMDWESETILSYPEDLSVST